MPPSLVALHNVTALQTGNTKNKTHLHINNNLQNHGQNKNNTKLYNYIYKCIYALRADPNYLVWTGNKSAINYDRNAPGRLREATFSVPPPTPPSSYTRHILRVVLGPNRESDSCCKLHIKPRILITHRARTSLRSKRTYRNEYLSDRSSYAYRVFG